MFKEMDILNRDYNINRRKPFIPIGKFKRNTIIEVLDFAYAMTFSGKGEHRNYRSGGTHHRRNGEIFSDTFQGKLAECALYNELYRLGLDCTKPDFGIYELGIWDDEDINVNNRSVSIKSTKSFGNLLLLEKKDWNNKGIYIPNKKAYDYIF